MKRSVIAGLLALVVCVSFPVTSFAGVYTDDLTKCLVQSTTDQDRVEMMKWIFFALAAHPSVSKYAAVSDADRENASKQVGHLFTKLLTDSCRKQAEDAVAYEGPGAIRASFQVLGRVASLSLFKSQAVITAMKSITPYLDKKKLEALGKETSGQAAQGASGSP